MHHTLLRRRPLSRFLSAFLSSLLALSGTLSALALPAPAFAAANSCSSGGIPRNGLRTRPRVGGVSLDMAATFLADMTDVTGAYYDTQSDRIVFLGRKNTAAPQFDKDDLVVAIRSVFFRNVSPSVSIDLRWLPDGALDRMQDVRYGGGIEDTAFGKTLFDADYKMKQYMLGYDAAGQPIQSSVPGYKSQFARYLEKNPDPSKEGWSRWWISPKTITLKRDTGANAFVFDTVQMQVTTEPLRTNNDPVWNQAAIEFAQQQTDLYDQFAAETPSYARVKQLAKIVAVVKWLKDNNIPTDLAWARNAQPALVSTPREIARIDTPELERNGGFWALTGGVQYAAANTYAADTGASSALKNASEAVPASNTDVHWSFSSGGTTYEAVAVSADALRALGAYGTEYTDLSIPLPGELPLSFTRTYSSFAGNDMGMGKGWDFLPARLTDNKPGWLYWCDNAPSARYRGPLGVQLADGTYESFHFACSDTYAPDQPYMHSQLTRTADLGYVFRLKNQLEYRFDKDLVLRSIADKNGNALTYAYDGAGRLTSVQDGNQHALTLSYGGDGRVSQVADFTGRKVLYTYANGDLVAVTDPRGNALSYGYDARHRLATVKDREAQTTLTLTYTEDNRIATQKDAYGTTITASYDNAARKITMNDNNGRSTTVKYDDAARVLEGTDALGGKVVYSYGQELSPLSVTDERNNKTTFTYDANGNATSATLPDGKKITYAYDAKNRVTQIGDERYKTLSSDPPKVTAFTYDGSGNATRVEEAGLATVFTYDAKGDVLSATDPLNQKTQFTRDALGNVVTATDPLSAQTAFQYDALGRLTKVTDPTNRSITYALDTNGNVLSANDGIQSVGYAYDRNDRTVSVQLPTSVQTRFSYNAAGDLTQVTDAKNAVTTYVYDAYGNLLARRNAAGKEDRLEFDKLDRATKAITPLGKTLQYAYDPAGNLTRFTDGLNAATTQTFDALNRPTQTSFADSTSITRSFDGRGNVLQVSGGAGQSTLSFDTFDRLTQARDPFGNTIAYAYDADDRLTTLTYPGTQRVTYAYDADDRLTTVTDWNNQSTQFTYFPNDLLQQKKLPGGLTENQSYDAARRMSQQIFKDAAGALLAQIDYERDPLGNIVKVTESGPWFSSSSSSSSVASSAQPSSQSSSISSSTPASSVQSSSRPSSSAPQSSSAPASSSPVSSSRPSSASSQPSSAATTLPDLIMTNLTRSVTNPAVNQFFDVTATIKNQGIATSPSAVFKVALYYDRATAPSPTDTPSATMTVIGLGAGMTKDVKFSLLRFTTAGQRRIWAYVDQGSVVAESSESNNAFGPMNVTIGSVSWLEWLLPKTYAQSSQFITTFTYDALGQLTKATYPEGRTYEYVYDAIGNRTQQKIDASAASYTYNDDAQLTQGGSITYAYDNNGALKTKTVSMLPTSFTFNAKRQLEKVGTAAQYAYDGFGNRVSKKVNAVETRFINDVSGELPYVLAETNAQNQAQSLNIYGLGLLSTGPAAAASRLYPLTDALGNVRFVVNASGQFVAKYAYDPFGNVRRKDGTATSPVTFAAEQSDAETGLTFLRARYYDPATGRFISRDPLVGPLGLPVSQNPYAYALGNPVNVRDPSGEMFFAPLLYYGGMACMAALPFVTGLVTNTPVLDITTIQIEDGNYIGAASTVMMAGQAQMITGAGATKTMNFSDHAVERMAQREVTREAAENVVNTAKPFTYIHDGVSKTGYYDEAAQIFVGEANGTITTVISPASPSYIRNLQNLKP